MTDRRCAFLHPGDLATRTGGYGYDRRIVAGLQALGWQLRLASLGAGYPMPGAAARAEARDVIASLPDGMVVVVDGLAFGALPELVEQEARRLCWVALVHHPLALETGLDAARSGALFASERRALAAARQVIVTSRSTARALADFALPALRIAVIEPGCDPAPPATGSGSPALSLLCVASLVPRKGHLLLIEALAALRDRAWTLHCAGSTTLDPDCAAAVRAAIDSLGLADRVLLHGEQDEAGIAALYARADAFVLPSFHEGYGMALAEALARGLPVISTTAGAIPDTVPAGAGALVPPGDGDALRELLRRLLDDAGWRVGLAAGARSARDRLPTWERSVADFAGVLVSVGEKREEDGA